MRDRPQRPLAGRLPIGGLRHGRNMFPGFRDPAGKSHELCHPGTGYSFLAGDVGPVADPAGVEMAPPLDGLRRSTVT